MKNLFSKTNILWAVLLIVFFFFIQFLMDIRIITPYYRSVLYWIGIYVILAASLNIIIGITGQLSLGHAGFMSIGGYAAAIVLRDNPTLTGLFIGMLIGMAISALVSFVVAMPTLRLKGDYLAIATLGVGEIIRIVILNMEITNGASGISNIAKLASWPLIYVFMVIALILSSNFKHSAIGRACISVNEDEIAAEAMGINTTKYKVIAFILLVTVSFVAMFYRIVPTLLSAVLSALIWNFFFIPPHFTLVIQSKEKLRRSELQKHLLYWRYLQSELLICLARDISSTAPWFRYIPDRMRRLVLHEEAVKRPLR